MDGPESKMRKIILIDLDSFFVSASTLNRPDLKGLPVAIGSEGRGVLSTVNYEGRKYGLRSAMPTHQAYALCPNLVLLPSDISLYRKLNAQFTDIFMEYTDIIQKVSLDEAYLDVTDSKKCQGSATWIAQEIRQKIWVKTNLTASAGVSYCKYLAKIASEVNKPNGIKIITKEQSLDFLANLSLKMIPGVGKVTWDRLESLNLRTCGDVKNKGEAFILKQFGSFGEKLWERCNGIDNNPVEVNRTRKSVGVEETLERDLYKEVDCIEKLYVLLPKLKKRLGPHLNEKHIHNLKVKLKFSDFEQITMEQSSNVIDLKILEDLMKKGLERRGKRGVRLIGVATGLRQNEENNQMGFEFISAEGDDS